MKQTLLTSAAVLLGIGALSNKPATTEVDLTPRFKKGQTFTMTNTANADMALDELSVMVDGAEVLGDGIGMEMLTENTTVTTEEILEVKDGQITAMRITFDEASGQMEGSFDAMGESDSMNESIDNDMQGHTIELRLDDEGELEVTDVTEDAEALLSDDDLAMLDFNTHFEQLLPTEPVEIGEEFELASEWMELVEEFMEEDMSGAMDDLGDEEAAMAEVAMESLFESLSIEASGKVTGVEDGMATIEYTMSAAVELDDLIGLASEISPEAGELPPGIEASMLMSLEMSGTGMFNLELGQLVALELEGDMSMEMEGAADMEGTSAEALAAASGTITANVTVEVE